MNLKVKGRTRRFVDSHPDGRHLEVRCCLNVRTIDLRLLVAFLYFSCWDEVALLEN